MSLFPDEERDDLDERFRFFMSVVKSGTILRGAKELTIQIDGTGRMYYIMGEVHHRNSESAECGEEQEEEQESKEEEERKRSKTSEKEEERKRSKTPERRILSVYEFLIQMFSTKENPETLIDFYYESSPFVDPAEMGGDDQERERDSGTMIGLEKILGEFMSPHSKGSPAFPNVRFHPVDTRLEEMPLTLEDLKVETSKKIKSEKKEDLADEFSLIHGSLYTEGAIGKEIVGFLSNVLKREIKSRKSIMTPEFENELQMARVMDAYTLARFFGPDILLNSGEVFFFGGNNHAMYLREFLESEIGAVPIFISGLFSSGFCLRMKFPQEGVSIPFVDLPPVTKTLAKALDFALKHSDGWKKLIETTSYSSKESLKKEPRKTRVQKAIDSLFFPIVGNSSRGVAKILNQNHLTAEDLHVPFSDIFPQKGVTALMIAAIYGNVQITDRLLEIGDNADQNDAKGRTALFYAAAGQGKNWEKIVESVFMSSSEVDLLHFRDSDGKNVFSYIHQTKKLYFLGHLAGLLPDLEPGEQASLPTEKRIFSLLESSPILRGWDKNVLPKFLREIQKEESRILD